MSLTLAIARNHGGSATGQVTCGALTERAAMSRPQRRHQRGGIGCFSRKPGVDNSINLRSLLDSQDINTILLPNMPKPVRLILRDLLERIPCPDGIADHLPQTVDQEADGQDMEAR